MVRRRAEMQGRRFVAMLLKEICKIEKYCRLEMPTNWGTTKQKVRKVMGHVLRRHGMFWLLSQAQLPVSRQSSTVPKPSCP